MRLLLIKLLTVIDFYKNQPKLIYFKTTNIKKLRFYQLIKQINYCL